MRNTISAEPSAAEIRVMIKECQELLAQNKLHAEREWKAALDADLLKAYAEKNHHEFIKLAVL